MTNKLRSKIENIYHTMTTEPLNDDIVSELEDYIVESDDVADMIAEQIEEMEEDE